MTLVVVYNRFIIKLGGSNTECVIGIGLGQKKPVVFQKGFDQFIILYRGFAKSRFLWAVIESARKLGQDSVLQQLLQMPVHGI